ncbi:SHK1 protein [Pelomyxa schiedti]|nr:SHK1 protein [Pelomyxa schiedti]
MQPPPSPYGRLSAATTSPQPGATATATTTTTTTSTPPHAHPPAHQPPQHGSPAHATPPPHQQHQQQHGGGGMMMTDGGGGGGGGASSSSSGVSMSTGPPEIDPSEIVLERVISDGSFGIVYKGQCRHKDVAVKVLNRQFDESTLEAFRKEVEIMSKIFHPNVSLFMGACTSIPGRLMMCNELLKQDLEALLLDPKVQLPLLLRLHMAKDAALGMLWLHSSKPAIIHRDLKSSNLLIDEHLHVKVCDFGLSQIKPAGQNLLDGREGAKGTPLWMAPEVLLGEEFNEKADVYSFGLILWQILTREELFARYTNLQDFAFDICKNNVRPVIPTNTNTMFASLIQACWHPNPTLRPDFALIVATLDEIILCEAIPEPGGRGFWKQHFLYQEVVTWQDFVNRFGLAHRIFDAQVYLYDILMYQPSRLGEHEVQLRCLRELLIEPVSNRSSDTEALCTMEQFGKILAWFGRFEEGFALLEKIRALMLCRWFHGDITTTDAELQLINKPEGAFLVRFSTSELGLYTISKVSAFGSIAHQRILHRPSSDAFTINSHTYTSLNNLVAGERGPLNLLIPCDSTRYTALFLQLNIQGYINSS